MTTPIFPRGAAPREPGTIGAALVGGIGHFIRKRQDRLARAAAEARDKQQYGPQHRPSVADHAHRRTPSRRSLLALPCRFSHTHPRVAAALPLKRSQQIIERLAAVSIGDRVNSDRFAKHTTAVAEKHILVLGLVRRRFRHAFLRAFAAPFRSSCNLLAEFLLRFSDLEFKAKLSTNPYQETAGLIEINTPISAC